MSFYTKITLILFFILSLSKDLHSMTSSSYLITNSAISSYDYEKASKYIDSKNFTNIGIEILKRNLIFSINSNKFKDAELIAKKIINLRKNDEDAWLVLLTFAKKNKNLISFKDFEKLINKEDFKIINYIFYENGKMENSNEVISYRLFDLFEESNNNKLIENKGIDYYFYYLNLALIFKPNLNEALYIKAQINQELKYHKKAEKLYNKIDVKDSLYIEGQKNIIIIKKNLKKYDEAKKLLNKLLIDYQNDNSLILLQANLFQKNKEYKKAIESFSSIIKNKLLDISQLWIIYYRRGICYEKINNWSKAKDDFLQALEIEPNQPQVLNYLAYGWIEQNINIDKSIKMLEVAIQKEPSSHYILDSLAWGHFKNNNLIKAAKLMEKVIDIAPGEAISLDHLGDIYFSLGRKREAFFMWNQALDLAVPEDNISESILLKIDNYNAG